MSRADTAAIIAKLEQTGDVATKSLMADLLRALIVTCHEELENSESERNDLILKGEIKASRKLINVLERQRAMRVVQSGPPTY